MSELLNDCGRPPLVGEACRQRVLHPDEFACERCARIPVSKLPTPKPPAKSAKIAEWVAWATRVGADPTYAGGRSRDELVEEFGARLPLTLLEPTPVDEVTEVDGSLVADRNEEVA